MANNQYVNKVQKADGTVIIDITDTTATASDVASGKYFYTASGEKTEGTYSGGGSSALTVATKTATLASASSSIQFTGLSGNPTSFVITSSADQSTGGTKVVAVAYDGTSLHGMYITSEAEADTGFSKSYSSGTLTVTATTATFQANEYKLVYTYGGSSSDIYTADVQVGSGATSITFTGLSGKPAYFSCVFKSDFSTSSGYQRVIDVVNDGSNTYGHSLDSSAHYSGTNWTYSYNGGSLTITSSSTNAGGYFHQPGYYQLTYAVDSSAPSLGTKNITTNGTYDAEDDGYDGYSSVTVNVSGGGSASIDTKSVTNSSNQNTSISFTSMKGQPKAFFARCTSSLTRSSSNSYYYVADMVYDGTSTVGNVHARSSGQYSNVTSGYSWSYSGTTLTLTSSGARNTSPGSFYNGTYELVYIY